MSQRFYSDDEAEAILVVAARKTEPNGITRDKLLAAAAELNISPEAVAEAERDVLTKSVQVAVGRETGQLARRIFEYHAKVFLLVNALLVLMDFATYRWTDIHWSIFSILGWGIGLAIHFAFTPHRRGSKRP